MRKLKRNIAAAMIMTMSLSMLPVQFNPTVASAAQTKKVTVKKTEITVNSNKGIKSALKNKAINRIILNAASVKNLNVPKGNYKDKTLVINLSEKSKIHIAKGARFKKIVLVGTVKNASLVIDEAGNKVEIASKTTLSISGKAAYAELTYKTGSEAAKVTSKLELIIKNRTKKTVKAVVAGKKVTVKAGETYSNENLDIKDDETAQGVANIDVNNDSTPQGSAVTDGSSNTTGGNAGGGTTGGGYSGGGSNGGVSTSPSNGGNSFDNGGSGNGGNNNTTPATPKVNETKVIDLKKSGMIELGFAKYAVVTFKNGYSPDNTDVYVDGVKVNEELTQVDKEGTIYKWEVTSPNHAELKVVSGDITETRKFKTDVPEGVKPEIKGEKHRTPAYIIGHAPVASWDYYPSVYDDEGNIRKTVKTTLLNSKISDTRKLTERKYYADEAVYGGNIDIKFNYVDESDKKWFDNIPETGAIDLVWDNENQTHLGSGIKYEKKSNLDGFTGKIAILSIPTENNGNIRTGYYRLRIKSKGNPAVMLRVKVVDSGIPEFKLKTSPVQSGADVKFEIENAAAGLGKLVDKVELILPDGEKRVLKDIRDYSVIGNLFTLYNDVTKGKEEDGTKGINNIPYRGNYILKVYFNAYKTIEKKFYVVNGEEVKKNVTASVNKVAVMGNKMSLLTIDGMKFDAVAGASKVSTSSNGSGGGSIVAPVSANLIFNVDLLVNAKILLGLQIDNVYAAGIAYRFDDMIKDAVYAEDGKKFYEWNDYNDAVNTARTEGKYLTFTDYVNSGKAKEVNRVATAKEVLEDNLLGEIMENGSFIGKTTEDFIYPKNIEGLKETDNVTIKASRDYINKFKAIYNSYYVGNYNGTKNEYAIKDDHYVLGEDSITIKASAFFRDSISKKAEDMESGAKDYNKELTVTIFADGYKPLVVKAKIKYVAPNPTNDKEEDKPLDNLKSIEFKENIINNKIGESYFIVIKQDIVKNNGKDWLQNISAVKVDGNPYSKKVPKDIYDNGIKENQYKVSDSGLRIPSYTYKTVSLVIESTGYKSYTFTIKSNSNEAPILLKVEETKKSETKTESTEPQAEIKEGITGLVKDSTTGNWKLYFKTEQKFADYPDTPMVFWVGNTKLMEGNQIKYDRESNCIEFVKENPFKNGENIVEFAVKGFHNIKSKIIRTGDTLTLGK